MSVSERESVNNKIGVGLGFASGQAIAELL
jgi:hypothetical protein